MAKVSLPTHHTDDGGRVSALYVLGAERSSNAGISSADSFLAVPEGGSPNAAALQADIVNTTKADRSD